MYRWFVLPYHSDKYLSMKYRSSLCTITRSAAGFTFIELLVSMSIMMLVGSMMLIVFFTTIKGKEKSQHLISLRQNGNFALSQMSRTIRQAEDAICSPTDDSVTVTSPFDRQKTTFVCTDPATTAMIASRSAAGVDVPLIDTTAVKTSSCSFSCSVQQTTQIPLVSIQFTLIPVTSSSGQADTQSLDFSAVIGIKNFQN
jgi:Tfp pilus assembly protein PilW